jgi:hypothetical protein
MKKIDVYKPADKYGKRLRLMNAISGIYIGDTKNGEVKAILGAGGKISDWDSSYERATLFTQDEAFKLAAQDSELAIVGLHPGIR